MDKEMLPGVIIGKLLNISGILQRHGNKMLKPFNMNQQQFSIFFEIAQAGNVTQKDVVNRLLLEKAHVSKVVKKLHHMGLLDITETDEDKRSYWLSVTPKGEKTLQQCTAMFMKWNAEWTDEIEDSDLASILDSVSTLQRVFKQKTR